LKRSLEDIDPNKPIVQDLWVNDQTYRITRLSVDDQRLQKSLLTDYSDHRTTDGGLFPFHSKTLIKAEKQVEIDIEFNKITLNNDPEFPFNIPSGYEKIR
jgi:outer membrane lipoprotein-sorting protein